MSRHRFWFTDVFMGSIYSFALASNLVSAQNEHLPKQTIVTQFMFDSVQFKLYSEEQKLQLLPRRAHNVRVRFNKSKQ